MNFFDYDLTRQATATPPTTAGDAEGAQQPTLNEEMNEVVGQLGRLWGGFRKQVRVYVYMRHATGILTQTY